LQTNQREALTELAEKNENSVQRALRNPFVKGKQLTTKRKGKL
jgi:hypothetical protein